MDFPLVLHKGHVLYRFTQVCTQIKEKTCPCTRYTMVKSMKQDRGTNQPASDSQLPQSGGERDKGYLHTRILAYGTPVPKQLENHPWSGAYRIFRRECTHRKANLVLICLSQSLWGTKAKANIVLICLSQSLWGTKAPGGQTINSVSCE